jgi:plastocyanin
VPVQLEREDTMRKLLMIPLLAAVLAIGAQASTGATHATKFVGITRTAFVPSSVAINTGDSITWTNSDSVNHQVASQSAGFASPILKPGDTFTWTFPTAGKFGYHDVLSKQTGNGSVTVTAPPVNVTASLSSSATAIVYGVNSVTLSGQLSNKAGGQQITLNEQATGESQTKALTSTTTNAAGEYSFTVSPTIRTVYSVEWHSGSNKATSSPVTVNVHPLVGLGRVFHRGTHWRFRTKVTSDISYQGHYVFFQRFSPAVGGWISLKRVFLGSTSSATFSVTMRPRVSKVRVFLTTAQAGNGYIWGVSRSLLAIR